MDRGGRGEIDSADFTEGKESKKGRTRTKDRRPEGGSHPGRTRRPNGWMPIEEEEGKEDQANPDPWITTSPQAERWVGTC